MDTYSQKISHLKLLYHLACVDNNVSKIELIYIKNVAEGLGINPEELEEFDGSEPDLDLPGREYKIHVLFHRLAILIMLENDVTEKEKRICFHLGIIMGLHPNAVFEVLEYIISNGPMAASPDHILAIFRKYSN